MEKSVPNPNYQFVGEPKTLGDKIKKRRLGLGLLQRDVAEMIGVTESCVSYWEVNQAQPLVSVFPKITEFLGYFPFTVDIQTLAGKMKEYRFRHGLSQEDLAKRLGINESTVFHYEKGSHKPNVKKLGLLESYLLKG